MALFKYFAGLRSEILEVVSGVQNAEASLFWDNTTPNFITRGKLEKLLRKNLNSVSSFGLYVVTRHSGCPNPRHGEYPTSNSYGLTIPYATSPPD